jgi:hypothetical protein
MTRRAGWKWSLGTWMATVGLPLSLAACGEVDPGGEPPGSAAPSTEAERSEGLEVRPGPDGRGGGLSGHGAGAGAGFSWGFGSNVSYHGGPVMLGTTQLYYIWYGDWSTSGGVDPQVVLGDLGRSIGGSPYFNINTTYYDASRRHVSNSVAFAGTAQVSASSSCPNDPARAVWRGTALNDTDIETIVRDVLQCGLLPADPAGVYLVLTARNVQETSGFCTIYCGWHDHASLAVGTSSYDIKYGFIGNPAQQCPSACSIQTARSPNGDIGADAMASVIAHELEEAVTDPDLNAWYDRRGQENADKCAWTFGTTYRTSSGALANMKLGARDFLIQRNWVNSGGGYCAQSF